MDHQLTLTSPSHVSAGDMASVLPMAAYTDCAQQAMAFTRSRFMDTVSMVPGGVPYSPAATSTVTYPHNAPLASYSPSMMQQPPAQPQLPQQQQQQQPKSQPPPQTSARILSSQPATLALGGVMPGGGQVGLGPPGYGPHCSLAKLQQLTNGIIDLLPTEAQMTPPPHLTTPPPVTMTASPGLMRSMTTPPMVTLHQQVGGVMGGGVSGVAAVSGAKYPQRQRPSSTAAAAAGNPVRKSPSVTPNVTVNTPNPNMPFSPNVTIQPAASLTRYQMNMFNGYRMPQQVMNHSYLNAGFLTQQVPVQMGMMNMNVHPQQFTPQMQQHPSQPNVYSSHYGYNLMNMNMSNMRR
ncbi:hypothetical protein ACOMHN_010878 [Nucella lapillus]